MIFAMDTNGPEIDDAIFDDLSQNIAAEYARRAS